MERLFTRMLVFMARCFVIAFFTFVYVTPLYVVLYCLVFTTTELLNEISMKCYIVSYFIGYIISYINLVFPIKKVEK